MEKNSDNSVSNLPEIVAIGISTLSGIYTVYAFIKNESVIASLSLTAACIFIFYLKVLWDTRRLNKDLKESLDTYKKHNENLTDNLKSLREQASPGWGAITTFEENIKDKFYKSISAELHSDSSIIGFSLYLKCHDPKDEESLRIVATHNSIEGEDITKSLVLQTWKLSASELDVIKAWENPETVHHRTTRISQNQSETIITSRFDTGERNLEHAVFQLLIKQQHNPDFNITSIKEVFKKELDLFKHSESLKNITRLSNDELLRYIHLKFGTIEIEKIIVIDISNSRNLFHAEDNVNTSSYFQTIHNLYVNVCIELQKTELISIEKRNGDGLLLRVKGDLSFKVFIPLLTKIVDNFHKSLNLGDIEKTIFLRIAITEGIIDEKSIGLSPNKTTEIAGLAINRAISVCSSLPRNRNVIVYCDSTHKPNQLELANIRVTELDSTELLASSKLNDLTNNSKIFEFNW